MADFLILFLIGSGIAIMTVTINSSTPVFVALMQVFFPQLSLGAIIGSFKVNAFVTSSSAVWSFRKNVDWKFVLYMGPIYVIGAFIGASVIAELPIIWVIPILIIAFTFAELAPKINKLISERGFYILEFIFGFYSGIFGASVKPMLMGLFRIKEPSDDRIIFLKMQIEAIVIFSASAAAFAHFIHGNLQTKILLPLICGSLIGGQIGGRILKRMGKLPAHYQKLVMRLSFSFGIIVSVYMVYGR